MAIEKYRYVDLSELNYTTMYSANILIYCDYIEIRVIP